MKWLGRVAGVPSSPKVWAYFGGYFNGARGGGYPIRFHGMLTHAFKNCVALKV